MSFMQPQIVFGKWYELDGPAGTEFVPHELAGDFWPFPHVQAFDFGDSVPVPSELADYCENRSCRSIKLREGWGARLSAPGYLDSTEWVVFETEKEAMEYLAEMEDDEEPDIPTEGDYETQDHISWYQYGKLVLTTADPTDRFSPADDFHQQLKARMEAEGFWPNAWFISDHGNCHLIDL